MQKAYFVYLHHRKGPTGDALIKVHAESTIGARVFVSGLTAVPALPIGQHDVGAAYTPTEARHDLRDWIDTIKLLNMMHTPSCATKDGDILFGKPETERGGSDGLQG